MLRPWYQHGKKVYADGRPVYCGECPCETPSTCQCIVYAYVMYGIFWDWDLEKYDEGHWLTPEEAEGLFPDPITPTSDDNIFFWTDSTDDGCRDLSEYGYSEGWQGWEMETHVYGGGEVRARCFSNIHIGPVGCKPCPGSMSETDCDYPTEFPALPDPPPTPF